MEKVLQAFRNCLTKQNCKGCPWEQCDNRNNPKVDIPISLALAVEGILTGLTKRNDGLNKIYKSNRIR